VIISSFMDRNLGLALHRNKKTCLFLHANVAEVHICMLVVNFNLHDNLHENLHDNLHDNLHGNLHDKSKIDVNHKNHCCQSMIHQIE